MFFSLADNDTDISKTHLHKAEQIIKLDFYLRLQNTENFALSASSFYSQVLRFLNLAQNANKMSFTFNFPNISKSRHFTVTWSKILKLLPETPCDFVLKIMY